LRNYRKAPEAISRLTPEQFRVTQQGGTELPNPGRYLHNTEPGIYADIVLGEPFFAFRISMNQDAADRASAKPSSQPTSKNVEILRMA
jgi:peptide methionine sulfoxide reductase MsrB